MLRSVGICRIRSLQGKYGYHTVDQGQRFSFAKDGLSLKI